MSETPVRSDVDVEQIMRQIRARVREKHGAAYTDTELRQLAAAKLDALLDPRGAHPELVAEFRKRATPGSVTDFSEEALYDSHRGWMKSLRKLLNPILKLFINPSAFSRAMQARQEIDGLIYDVVQNLVIENTRLSLETQNLKMRVESLSTRMDFDARRTKAFENVPPSRPIQQDRPRHQGRGPGGSGGFRQGPPQGQQTQHSPHTPSPQVQPSPQAPPSPQPAAFQGSTGQPAAPSVQGGPSPTSGGDGQMAGGDSRRRRRRRRRRRPGQGPQGPQGSQGPHSSQGPQGQQGPQGPQGQSSQFGSSSPSGQGDQPSSYFDAGDGDDGPGDDFDDGEDGASDQ